MDRSTLLPASCLAAWILLAGPAQACLPPLALSPTDQAAHDLAEQSRAWTEATTVYVARVALSRVYETRTNGAALPPPAFQLEVVLSAEVLLKGELAPDASDLPVLVTPSCVPSDIARGRVGDRFIIYAGAEGPSTRSGIISLARLRHPETLDALARAAADMTTISSERPMSVRESE